MRETWDQTWEISSTDWSPIVVMASNWLAALGLAFEAMGVDASKTRVACERLPNETVIVNDLISQTRYTVRSVACVHL